ncbi:hypothetical protein E2C01_058617 [Portunus trituberculatus]|uniref:Uncharacterized protein n=1 Tax=Portunus trituberculatus TaxID=210409 RepID=A0A5B7GW18_PORTR|nr:hypothetical protein [Portunus trituberculatus]
MKAHRGPLTFRDRKYGWEDEAAGGVDSTMGGRAGNSASRLSGTPDATLTIFRELEIVQVEQPKKSCIGGRLATHKETMRECRGQVEDEWRANTLPPPPRLPRSSLGVQRHQSDVTVTEGPTRTP